MDHLTKEDLAQMDRDYFHGLGHEILIDVACRLRDLSIELLERLDQDSSNSSRPPSSDNPYKKGKDKNLASEDDAEGSSEEDAGREAAETSESAESLHPDEPGHPAGRQAGAQGFWRAETPVAESTIPHYPEHCAVCGEELDVSESSKPYMGYYVFELEKTESGIRIICTLHHYYVLECSCGHETKARPGEGYISCIEGRKKDLKLTEYSMVGPMLATFLAALSVRYRMSREKIREYLSYWLSTELSVGNRSVRPGKVAYSSGCESRSSKAGQPLDRGPWAGGSNSKGQAQGDQDNRP